MRASPSRISRAVAEPMPSTDSRSDVLADMISGKVPKRSTRPLDQRRRELGQAVQQAVAPGGHLGVELVVGGRQAQNGDHLGQIHEGVGRRAAQAGLGHRAGIVPQDQGDGLTDAGTQLLGLQMDESAVRSQFDEMLIELLGDTSHHLAWLQHGHDVAHRDGVLHLEAGQRGQGVVEAHPEALLGGQGLAGSVDQPPEDWLVCFRPLR